MAQSIVELEATLQEHLAEGTKAEHPPYTPENNQKKGIWLIAPKRCI